MSLINYDLYDLYALFCYLRHSPSRLPDFRQAVRQIITAVYEPAEVNRIRHILRPCAHTEDIALSWVLTDNEYSADVRIIRDASALAVVCGMLEELLQAGDDQGRVYLLCDSVHNIPLILADPGRHHMPFKDMLRDYRMQYAPSFLKAELARL